MGRPIPSVCKTRGCPELTPCEAHPAEQMWDQSTRSSELPGDWKARKRRRHEADDWTCQHPGCGYRNTDGKLLECHHLGDKHDHSHAMLQTLCKTHHAEDTKRDQAAGRARQRAS